MNTTISTSKEQFRHHWMMFLGASINPFKLLLQIFKMCFVVPIIIDIIKYFTTTITVDRFGIHVKRGLVNITQRDFNFKSIEQLQVQQDFLGQILGYGKITIHGTGIGGAIIDCVANAKRLQELFYSLQS